MYNKNVWKWNFTILSILIGLSLWTNSAKALDDFDIIRYGPEVQVNATRMDFIINIVPYESMQHLNTAYQKETDANFDIEIAGYSLSHPLYDVCEVHIVIPKIWDDHETLTILGHEVLHCMLADHEEESNDLTRKLVGETEVKLPTEVELSDEELLKLDRQLELEWLREDYEKMGIVVDE